MNETRVDIRPYRDGKMHVLSKQCETCILRSGNPMHLDPGAVAQIVQGNVEMQSALVCHDTLPYGKYPNYGAALCRGYWDRFKDKIAALILAQYHNIVEEVEPPGGVDA